MYDIMHMFVSVHVMPGSQAKVVHLPPFFKKKTNTFSYDIFTAPNMSARQALMWFIDM